jgi:hypothetical protein
LIKTLEKEIIFTYITFKIDTRPFFYPYSLYHLLQQPATLRENSLIRLPMVKWSSISPKSMKNQKRKINLEGDSILYHIKSISYH